MQKGSQNSRILGKVLQGNQSIGLKAGAMFLSIDTNYLQDFFAPEYIGCQKVSEQGNQYRSQGWCDVPEY